MNRIVVAIFVLLLAVGLFYFTTERGPGPAHDVASDVQVCKERLRAIYGALVEKHGGSESVPTASGVGFLGELVAGGAWDAGRASELSCPGPAARPVPDGADFTRVETLGPEDSAYACRDTAAFPLVKFPAGGPDLEILMACDNAIRSNHPGAMNLLYSDGTVKTLILAEEIVAGRLPEGTSTIAVGPESPVEDLRKLVSD